MTLTLTGWDRGDSCTLIAYWSGSVAVTFSRNLSCVDSLKLGLARESHADGWWSILNLVFVKSLEKIVWSWSELPRIDRFHADMKVESAWFFPASKRCQQLRRLQVKGLGNPKRAQIFILIFPLENYFI